MLKTMAKYRAKEDITCLKEDTTIEIKDIVGEFSALMKNFEKKEYLKLHKIDLCCQNIKKYNEDYENLKENIYYNLYCIKFMTESFLGLKPTKILGVEIGNNVDLRIENPWSDVISYQLTIPSIQDEKFYCLIKEIKKLNHHDYDIARVKIDLMNRIKCFVIEIIEYE